MLPCASRIARCAESASSADRAMCSSVARNSASMRRRSAAEMGKRGRGDVPLVNFLTVLFMPLRYTAQSYFSAPGNANSFRAANRKIFPSGNVSVPLVFKSVYVHMRMHSDSIRYLEKCDPVMRRLIRTHGPCALKPRTRHSPFQSLAQAIAHQQLNGTAANTILRRFIQLFPGRTNGFVINEAIRAAGFSRAKIAALRD